MFYDVRKEYNTGEDPCLLLLHEVESALRFPSPPILEKVTAPSLHRCCTLHSKHSRTTLTCLPELVFRAQNLVEKKSSSTVGNPAASAWARLSLQTKSCHLLSPTYLAISQFHLYPDLLTLVNRTLRVKVQHVQIDKSTIQLL